MIKKALEAAKPDNELTILGVTILTSLKDSDLNQTGINLSTEEAVLKLCQLGVNSGLNAFVCSPQEIAPIRKRFGQELILITPGIRPHWASQDDQKRIFTPRTAINLGSDYLVIGRPITKNQNPAEAFQRILSELEN